MRKLKKKKKVLPQEKKNCSGFLFCVLLHQEELTVFKASTGNKEVHTEMQMVYEYEILNPLYPKVVFARLI